MFILLFVILLCTVSAQSDSDKNITTESKVRCIKQLIEWCNSKNYALEKNAVSLVSVSYQDNFHYYRVVCSTNVEGTNCTWNGSLWLKCAPDHTLTYKDAVLTETTTDVDDDVCKIEGKSFRDFFTRNSFPNSSTLEFGKELESFFEETAAMQEQIESIRKQEAGIPIMGQEFWSKFNNFPFPQYHTSTAGVEEGTNKMKREY